MRLAYYAGASTAAAAACLIKAFHERPNFYSATVYLSQSNACVLILTNLLLICAFGSIYTLQRLLYGRLRPIEVEQLSEKAWYAVLDTLLAMPSFREDVGGWLLTMFVLLLAGKVWGWIGEGRVDVLEQQPPANPRLFHARLATSLLVSVAFDMWMTYYCFDAVVANPKPGMMVIFTFEFAILTIFSSFTFLRYTLSVTSAIITQRQTLQAIEIRKSEIRAERLAAAAAREGVEQEAQATTTEEEPIEVDENEVDVPGWEEKRRWLFGLEVFTDFLKLLLYVVFFTVSITFNGLPMHIMRDVYMTAASFSKRITDYVNYKKATSDMNARYPDATTEEIRGDACIVCREDMVAWSEGEAAGEQGATRQRRDEGQRAKKLPCNHILHLRCLKAWLERQQVCPTCRRPVVSVPRPVPISAAVAPADGNAQAGAAPVIPPAADNNAAQQAPAPAPATGQQQAQAPAQPQAQAQAQAPVARQQPAMNRARFFNLGPLRIGFLNGPVGQIDNLVEHLRNGQQGAAQQPQPQNVPQSTNSSRVSQNEIADMGNRLMQEAALLNIERTQLENLRMMRHELDRLRHLHSMQQNQSQQPAVQPGLMNPAIHPIPPVTQLNGNHSQQIPAGSNDLPQGLVLPEGWTLTPLRRQQPFNQHVVMPQAVNHAVPTPPTSQMPGHTTTQAQSGTNARAENTTAPHGSNDTADQIGPVDDSGSPLFVPQPRETEPVMSSALPEAVKESSQAEENKESVPRDTANAPWSSSDWNFGSQDETETAQGTSNAIGSSAESSEKGKGKAVQIEDAPNSES